MNAYHALQIARDARLEGRDEAAAAVFDEFVDVAWVRRSWVERAAAHGTLEGRTGQWSRRPFRVGMSLISNLPPFPDTPVHYSIDLMNATGRRLADQLAQSQATGLVPR